MTGRARRIARATCAVYLLVIAALSSIPAARMPDVPELWRWDKLVHALEYAGLGALFTVALPGSRSWPRAVVAVAFALSFAFLDEAYQSTIPGRDSSFLDVVADFVGASFGATLAIVLYSRWENLHGDHSKLRK